MSRGEAGTYRHAKGAVYNNAGEPPPTGTLEELPATNTGYKGVMEHIAPPASSTTGPDTNARACHPSVLAHNEPIQSWHDRVHSARHQAVELRIEGAMELSPALDLPAH
jgi:hypothetical protein